MTATVTRRRRGLGWGVTLGLALLATAARGDFADLTPDPPRLDRYRIGAYELRCYRDPDKSAAFEIWRGAERLIREEADDGSFSVATNRNCEGFAEVELGQDLTGNGQPDLVVMQHTGGAHCCSIWHIFEVGERFRRVGRIDAGHAFCMSGFQDIDGDGDLEFVVVDWTFAYWKTSYAGSPAPEVALEYRDGAYRIAPHLMRTAAPRPEDLRQMAAAIQDEWGEQEKPPSELWKPMLNLMYGGHEAAAWELFELAWPADRPGKAEFVAAFNKRLAESEYWPALEKFWHTTKP